MKTIEEILERLDSDHDALIARPATDDEIASCNNDMREMGFSPLPEGYSTFLKRANGFAWNGIEFYSTYQVTETGTGYILWDIVSANEDFEEVNGDYDLEHCVSLGRSDEDMYVYNTGDGRYEVLDRTGRDVMADYETFEAMFAGEVTPRMHSVSELD